jgi:hypothetical protein
VIAAAGVVVVVSAGLVAAGCGSSAKRAADTTPVPVPSTSEARPSTTWSRTQAEAEVRAAYQNFRVKLRELTFHPNPASTVIGQVWVGGLEQAVRDKQRSNLARGLTGKAAAPTRWRIERVIGVSNVQARVVDCQVNADLVMRRRSVLDRSIHTYESELEFVHGADGRWRVAGASLLSMKKGVAGCALSD